MNDEVGGWEGYLILYIFILVIDIALGSDAIQDTLFVWRRNLWYWITLQ